MVTYTLHAHVITLLTKSFITTSESDFFNHGEPGNVPGIGSMSPNGLASGTCRQEVSREKTELDEPRNKSTLKGSQKRYFCLKIIVSVF